MLGNVKTLRYVKGDPSGWEQSTLQSFIIDANSEITVVNKLIDGK